MSTSVKEVTVGQGVTKKFESGSKQTFKLFAPSNPATRISTEFNLGLKELIKF